MHKILSDFLATITKMSVNKLWDFDEMITYL